MYDILLLLCFESPVTALVSAECSPKKVTQGLSLGLP